MKKTKVTVQVADTKGLFSKVEGVVVMLRDKAGAFTQRDVYQRGGQLYASVGQSFLGLSSNHGGTCSTRYTWTEFVPTTNEPFVYIKPHCGYLEVSE